MSPNRTSPPSWRKESAQTTPARRAGRASRMRQPIAGAAAVCLCLIFSLAAALGAAPAPRHGHALAYNSARDVVILFGGARGDQILSDTWELRQSDDGLRWKNLRATGPALRPGIAMAENPAGVTTLLVGTNALTGAFETWEFDGRTKSWTRAAPGLLNPAASDSYAMALDEDRGVVVLFGGGNTALGFSAETWEWDAARKTWLGPLSALPSARSGHALAYEGHSGTTLLFGGDDGQSKLGDSWTWDGVAWSAAFPLSGPSPRSGHAMAKGASVTFLFGGHDGAQALGDTWRWDGSAWLRLSPAAVPPPRSRHAMAAGDLLRETTVLFGGLDAGGNDLGDTWVFTGTNWTPVAQ